MAKDTTSSAIPVRIPGTVCQKPFDRWGWSVTTSFLQGAVGVEADRTGNGNDISAVAPLVAERVLKAASAYFAAGLDPTRRRGAAYPARW